MNYGVEIVKHFEGLHDGDLSVIGLQPKECPAGIWTIGYGRALTDKNGKFLKGEEGKAKAYEMFPALTEAEAEAMLQEDYNRFESIVKSHLTREPKPNELQAMTSLAFNVGAGNFAKSAVLRYFNRGDLKTAAESFKSFVKSGGKVLPGLQRRRRAEAYLFLNNKIKLT